MTPLIGCDPEFFLFDSEHKEYVSAHDKIPGNKEAPHKLKHGACQADGMAVEFNIDPASTSEEFVYNINMVLSQVRQMIPTKYKFHFEPIVQFKSVIMDATPADSKKLGCDPDFIYVKGKVLMNDAPLRIANNRTSSGHIHIGWTKGESVEPNGPHAHDCGMLAFNMYHYFKYIQGIWDPNFSSRLAYYGANGSFRPKPYGCEFRHLSSAWVKYPKLWPYIYQASVDSFNRTEEGTMLYGYYPDYTVEGTNYYLLRAKQTPIPTDFKKEVWYGAI